MILTKLFKELDDLFQDPEVDLITLKKCVQVVANSMNINNQRDMKNLNTKINPILKKINDILKKYNEIIMIDEY